MPAMILLLVAAFMLGQGDPGTIVVVDGDLAVVTFALSAGTRYQVDYPTSRLSLWLDSARTIPAAPLTTYTARRNGDVDKNGVINTRDIACFLRVLGNVGPTPVSTPCDQYVADLNGDGTVDELDVLLLVEALLGGYPAEGVVLYAEGIAPSSALGDATVELLTDPGEEGTFTISESSIVTVVDISFSPNMGPLGTPVTISMAPAIPPLAFDENTRLSWAGVFQPSSGEPGVGIAFEYSAAAFREQNEGQAIVIAGESSGQGSVGLEAVGLPGSLAGTATLRVGIYHLKKPFTFTPTAAPLLTAISYDPLTAEPFIGPVPETLEIVMTSNGDGANEIILAGMAMNHCAVIMGVQRNTFTETDAPSSVLVTLRSLDQQGAVLQTVPNLSLVRDEHLSDAQSILYHSEFEVPIILVEEPLDPSDYSLVLPLHAVDQGRLAITLEGS